MEFADDWYEPPIPRRGQAACPDCGSFLKKRATQRQSPLQLVIYYHCQNLYCSATFKGYEEIVYRLKRPRHMNPDVYLPVSHGMRDQQPLPAPCGRNVRDLCPKCGAGIYKQIMATNDPCQFNVYAECSVSSCDWSVSALADLKPDTKSAMP